MKGSKNEWRALLVEAGGFEGLTDAQKVELENFLGESTLKAIDELSELYQLTPQGSLLSRELKRFLEFANEDTKESEKEHEGNPTLN